MALREAGWFLRSEISLATMVISLLAMTDCAGANPGHIPLAERCTAESSTLRLPREVQSLFVHEVAAEVGPFGLSYAARVASASPVSVGPDDLVERNMPVNGQPATVVIKAPFVNRIIRVAPIGKSESAITYFAKAMAAAGSHTTVIFPAGQTYDFGAMDCVNGANPHYKPAYVQIEGATDMVIDGRGSTLNFTSPCPGVVLKSVARVVVKNFVVDWPRLPIAALGRITAIGGDAKGGYRYDMQLDSEYVGRTAPEHIASVTAWDRIHGYWSLDDPLDDVSYGGKDGPSLLKKGSVTGARSYGVKFRVGEAVLVRYEFDYPGAAVEVGSGTDVSFQSITLNSSPQVGFFVRQGRGVHLDHCVVTRSNRRPISLMADAVHISGAVGGDIIIENSTFAYQGDDGLNINAPLFPIGSNPNGDTIKVPEWFPAQAGDPIAFFGSTLGLLPGEHGQSILKVTAHQDGTQLLTVRGTIPRPADGGFFADLAAASARYIVRNNQYSHNRGRGILLQSPYGTVQGNSFAGQTAFPVYIVSSTFWREGPGAQNLLLAGNCMSQSGRGGGLGAIVVAREDASANPVYMSRAGSRTTPRTPATHQNLIFADNLIRDMPGAGFYISSANNVVLYHNELTDTVRWPMPNTFNSAPTVNAPIVVNDASNVQILGNSFHGWSRGDPIAVDSSTTDGTTIQR